MASYGYDAGIDGGNDWGSVAKNYSSYLSSLPDFMHEYTNGRAINGTDYRIEDLMNGSYAIINNKSKQGDNFIKMTQNANGGWDQGVGTLKSGGGWLNDTLGPAMEWAVPAGIALMSGGAAAGALGGAEAGAAGAMGGLGDAAATGGGWLSAEGGAGYLGGAAADSGALGSIGAGGLGSWIPAEGGAGYAGGGVVDGLPGTLNGAPWAGSGASSSLGLSDLVKKLGGSLLNGGGGGSSSSGSSGGGLFGSGGSGVNYGNLLGLLYGAYSKNQMSNKFGDILDQMQNMYKPGSAEANLMRQQLDARDAAAGRRSQYGSREVELAGKLANARMNTLSSPGFLAMQAAQMNNAPSTGGLSELLAGLGGNGGLFGNTGNSVINNLGNTLMNKITGKVAGTVADADWSKFLADNADTLSSYSPSSSLSSDDLNTIFSLF